MFDQLEQICVLLVPLNFGSTLLDFNCSIAIDGSDMSCYELPYFSVKTKSSDKGYKIPIKLTGVKVHGWGHCTYTFPCNVPTGANATIECLHRTIEEMKSRYEQVENSDLPETIFIQVLYSITNRWITVGEKTKTNMCLDM